jgi:outer membrane protein assembly factor BamB
MSAYCASSPVYHSFEPIILNGVLYYNVWAAQTDNAGIAAVSLRTGQTLWMKNTTDVLVYGQVLSFHNNEEFGSQAFLWATEGTGYGLIVPPPNTWDILDPVNGNTMAEVTNVPASLPSLFATSPAALIDSEQPTGEFYTTGSILIYWLNSTYSPMGVATATSLTMWNSSQCLMPNAMDSAYKPTGTYNFEGGIQWSVPIPAADTNYSIAYESNQAILLTSEPLLLPTFLPQWGGSTANDIAYSPYNGTMLWGPVTNSLVSGHELDILAIGDGVYVRHDKDTDQVYGYSLATGKQLWGPTQLVGDALSHLYSSAAIAYGQCYIWDYGGYVNAVNLTTGKLDWTWTRGSAGYNNPYGVYPIWVYNTQSIADGMIFLSEGRLYDPPLFPGAEKLAINCTTGQLVWEINGAFQRDVSPIADGEMLGWNGYDGQIYAFGMGPTKTTVTAPDVSVTTAAPVTITGTVTDISAGSQQNAVAANFPNGLPCVSDASMTPFMEAVYEQQPMPTNLTGVPVTIAVTDKNGNYYKIGTTTTDPTTGFFSLNWTPIISGNFTVTATFAGTQAYYGSSAKAAFYASAPSATAAPTSPPVQGLATLTDLTYGIVAVIVVIVIAIAIVGLLLSGKRP